MLLAVVVGLSVAKDGFGSTPNLTTWLAMAKTFPDRPPGFPSLGNYLFGSPAGPAVAHVLGATGLRSYPALHFAVFVAAVAVLVIGLRRRGGRTQVGVGIVALFASALSNTVPSLLGLQDPFTVGFMSLAVLFDSPVLLVVAGAGLGVSQASLGVIAVGTISGLRILGAVQADTSLLPTGAVSGGQRDRVTGACLSVAALLVGFLVGAVLTLAYQRHAGAGSVGELRYYQAVGPHRFLDDWLANLLTFVFTVFGVWWLVLVSYGRRLLDRREAVLFGIVVAVAVLLPVVTADETRVAALVVWPLVAWSAVRLVFAMPARQLRAVVTTVFLLAAVLPRVWVQGGATIVSSWHPQL